MKKVYIILGVLLMSSAIFAQTSQSVEMKQFLDNQKKTFLNANTEVFLLDGTCWTRAYGEKEYCLTPTMQDINEYEARIHQKDNKENGVCKSKFHFLKVEINDKNKKLLSTMNIFVPEYVQNNVNVYLPEIDIDKLIDANVNFTYLNDYGKQAFSKPKNEEKGAKSIIWSDGFETNSVPGSNYFANNGTTNCGWGDVNCYQHSGTWSVWCASNGAACNACLGNYVNNMDADFGISNHIDVSSYHDISFTYWIDLDLNNSGTNDEFRRYDDLTGGGYTLEFTATSASPWDGQLWQQVSVDYTGQSFNYYAFAFAFSSNWTGTSYGVYLDDLELTGTPSVGIEDIDISNQVNIYPSPTSGIFSIEAENIEKIEITNIMGQLIKQIKVNSNKNTIDLSSQPNGIYFIKVVTDKGSAREKIVKE